MDFWPFEFGGTSNGRRVFGRKKYGRSTRFSVYRRISIGQIAFGRIVIDRILRGRMSGTKQSFHVNKTEEIIVDKFKCQNFAL